MFQAAKRTTQLCTATATLQVTIGDASPEALELLLRLMYAGVGRPPATGQQLAAATGAAIPTEQAVALFTLADRYDIKASVDTSRPEPVANVAIACWKQHALGIPRFTIGTLAGFAVLIAGRSECCS